MMLAERHYVLKRLLSSFLVLAILLGLLPVSALAAGADRPAEVAYQGEQVTSEDGLVTVHKTARHTGGNDFDITLEVTAKDQVQVTPADSAHIVLVIDRSNSMAGRRLSSAREAAKDFVEIVLGPNAQAEDNQIAVVSYSYEYEDRIGLSDDISLISRAIDCVVTSGIEKTGGTNIQAGIYRARQILEEDPSDAKKIILVLTDGEPTYSYEAVGTADWTGCRMVHDSHSWMFDFGKAKNVQLEGFHYGEVAGSGSGYYMSGSMALTLTCPHGLTEDVKYSYYSNNGTPTILEAGYAKESGIEIYSVFLGNQENTQATGTMSGVASGDDHFMSTDDVNELAEIYKGIANTIVTPTMVGGVTDPMGEFIVMGDVSSLADQGVTATEDGLNWDVSKATPVSTGENSKTYRITYPITLNTSAQGFVEDHPYLTNGTTTFTYQVDGAQRSVNFDVPKVKGYLPGVDYTINYWYWDRENETYIKDKTTTGSAKLWSKIMVDPGDYSRENYGFAEGPRGEQTLTRDNMIFDLYYKPIPATVVVKHWVSEADQTDDGLVYREPQLQNTNTYDNYCQGDRFTNEVFLDPEVYEQVEELTVGETTYQTDSYTDVKLSSGQNVINIYYIIDGEEMRTPVDYEIHYWYREDFWQINEDGKFQKMEGEYTEDTGKLIQAQNYHGVTVTAPDYSGADYQLDEERTPSTSMVLDKNGENRLDIYYYKDSSEVPEAGRATLTILHKYYELTIDGQRPVEADDWTEYDNQWVLVGETWYATPDLKDGYTLQTSAENRQVTITEADKHYTIVVEYVKDLRVPADIVTNHYYTTYTWTVDPDTGAGAYQETGTDELLGIRESGAWYAGQTYTPKQIPNGYTYVRGGDAKVLAEGENVFDLYYETYVGGEADEADVTVNHIYETYTSYVDENGNVVRDELSSEKVSDPTHYGVKGDVVTVETKEKDNFKFYKADTDDLKATLVGPDGQYNVYYRWDNDQLGDPIAVQVQPIYKTYTTRVNSAGQIVTMLIDTEYGDRVSLGDFYMGQKVSALASDYGKDGFTYDPEDEDNTEGLSLTVTGSGDVIYVVYSKTDNDLGLPGVVLVNNVYTTVTKYVENGEVKTSENTVTGSNTTYGGYYVGQYFDTEGKETGRPGYVLDENAVQPEAQVKIEGEETQVTFYWICNVDQTNPATVQVIHHYTLNDANPYGQSTSWTVGENDAPLTGYYVGQYFLAACDYQNGQFGPEDVKEVQPEGATTDPGVILQASENVIHIYYERNIDTRKPTGVTVKHEYYLNEEALEAGTAEATYQEEIKAVNDKPLMDGDSYTAVLRLENDTMTYLFRDAEPENYAIASLAPDSANTIVIRYVRALAKYTVVHAYYTNDTLSGTVEAEYDGKAGDIIRAEDLTKLPEFEGETYGYAGSDQESITLVAGDGNVITLRYNRTTGSEGPSERRYSLVVKYLEEDTEEELAAEYRTRRTADTTYDVSARTEREIEGYTMTDVTGDPVSGTMDGNKEIIVWYVEDTDIDDGDTPLDPTPPTTDPDKDPDKDPDTDPDESVDIDDGDTPLGPAPGEEGDGSGSGDPDGAGTPDGSGDLDIVDDGTPLGDLPQTGMVAAPVNPSVTAGIVAMSMSMAATGMYFLFGRKKKDDEDE